MPFLRAGDPLRYPTPLDGVYGGAKGLEKGINFLKEGVKVNTFPNNGPDGLKIMMKSNGESKGRLLLGEDIAKQNMLEAGHMVK